MAKKTFVTLRVLIVAFTMLIFGWLFLSRPYIHASLSGVSCEPVGWNFLERPYSSLSYVEGDGDEIETFMNENHFDESISIGLVGISTRVATSRARTEGST